jgi:acetyl esterase/lipase
LKTQLERRTDALPKRRGGVTSFAMWLFPDRASAWLSRGAAFLSLALASCSVSSLDVLNATVAERGVTVLRDVAYGPAARQRMDVYRPEGLAAGAPVVVFVHGGAWRTGSRQEYRFMGVALARMGFVGVVAGYGLYPEVGFPGFVADVAAAVAAARGHAAEWGGDPARVVLMGHSAGAHIAAMVALDSRWLAAAGMRRADLAGFVGISGPYDFLPMLDPEVRAVFGVAANRPESQPVNFVDGQAPPALLLHGLDDRVVYPSNTISLAARIAAAGGRVSRVLYPGTGHIDIILAFTPLFGKTDGIAADVAAFVRGVPGVGR